VYIIAASAAQLANCLLLHTIHEQLQLLAAGAQTKTSYDLFNKVA